MRYSTRKQLPAMIGASIACAACLGGVGYIGWQSIGQKVADEFGCYEDVYARQTVTIMDSSEPRFDEIQARSLKNHVDDIYNNLEANERYTMYTTEADLVGTVVKPRFSLCGQASTKQALKEAIGAEAETGYLKRLKEKLYNDILAPELHSLFAPEADETKRQNNQSPVLEMVQSISRQHDFEPGDRLHLISDLLQHSDTVKFCREFNDMPSFEDFSKRRIWKRLKPKSLNGAEVTVLMLMRGGYGTSGLQYCKDELEIQAFFEDYFYDIGAGSVEFIRVRPALTEAKQTKPLTPTEAITTKKPQRVAAKAVTLIKANDFFACTPATGSNANASLVTESV